jgi:glutamate racemase
MIAQASTKPLIMSVAACVCMAAFVFQSVMAGEALVTHVSAHPDGRAAFSFDHSAYREDPRRLPIGVFDSGIGGLTVLEAILSLDAFDNDTLQPGADGRRDFENERFIYLGDQANMPYGNYSAAGREDYLRELILKDGVFLLGRRAWESAEAKQPHFNKPPVKAIVIACNTATAYGLDDLRAAIKTWGLSVPVIGVVEAGARGVNEITPASNPGTVAVLATVGTCSSKAYPKAITSAVGLAGKSVPNVVQQGCVGLAGAIEGDAAFISGSTASTADYQGPSVSSKSAPLDANHLPLYQFDAGGLLGDLSQPATLRLNSVENYVRYEVASLLTTHIKSGAKSAIDTVVLGCTHFPLAQEEISAAFARLREYEVAGAKPYRDLIAENIRLVNPAELTAKELFRTLASARLRLKSGEPRALEQDAFFISVPDALCKDVKLTADGALDKDYKYTRLPGSLDREDTRNVPMRVESLPAASLNLIRTRLPEVWTRLEASVQ